MRVVIQRVSKASLSLKDTEHASIGQGLVILLGIESLDDETDIDWLVSKVIQLRIFGDHNGQMNLSLEDINGEILLVSQFTLYASTKKGNRPGFTRAAVPNEANEKYRKFAEALEKRIPNKVKEGVFGADMKINLINEGPVTIIMDTKNKE